MAIPRPTSRAADWRSLLSMLAFGHHKVASGSANATRPARAVEPDRWAAFEIAKDLKPTIRNLRNMTGILRESEAKQLEAVLAWASVAYAAGFLTVMVHTARLGIPVIELIKPVYIWIGLPLALVVFSTRWLVKIAKSHYDLFRSELSTVVTGLLDTLRDRGIESGESNELARLATEVLVAASSLLPFGAIVSLAIGVPGLQRDFLVSALRVFIELLLKSPRVRSIIIRSIQTYTYIAQGLTAVNRFLSIAAILSLIPIGCFLYIYLGYPVIPQSMGGGKPMAVVLIVNSEKIPFDSIELGKLFPNKPTSGSASKAVESLELELLYSTADEYFIRASGQPIVSLNKGAVEGIVWLETD